MTIYYKPPSWYLQPDGSFLIPDAGPEPGFTVLGFRNPYPIVAAFDAPVKEKITADYWCPGTDDDVMVQMALDSLPAAGGRIRFTSGTFTFGATVARAIDKVSLSGAGQSTFFQHDGVTPLFDLGVQDGWTVTDLATDGAGVDIEHCTNHVVSYWKNGVLTTYPVPPEASGLTGLTASVAELNALDGITADVSELNKTDGLTATAAEVSKTAGLPAAAYLKVNETISITETAGAGTYTGTFVLPAGALITRLSSYTETSFDADTIVLLVNEGLNSIISSQSIKASETVLDAFGIAGEWTDLPFKRYSTAVTISVGATSTGTGGTSGKALVTIEYAVPTPVAATKT